MKDTTALERPIEREGRKEAPGDAAGESCAVPLASGTWPRVPLAEVADFLDYR